MSNQSITQEPRTIVQLVLIDETGDSYYRMRWPGKHVAEQASAWRVISLDARAEERFVWAEEADLLIIYQSNDLDLLPLIERRRQRGKKTLAEYNDNFYAPPPASPVAEPWSSPLIWQSYERLMEAADGVIVTGPGLQELFSKKTRTPIYVLENHLPEDPPPFEELFKDTEEEVIFGWAGLLGHISDVLAVIPLVRKLLESFPQLRLHLMGNDSIPGLLRVPPERIRFTNWGTMQDYYQFWMPVHLGFAPLLDTPYNRCRSDIKAVEMSARGVLPILADCLPYKSFIKETKSPRFKNHRELELAIQGYIKKPERIRSDTIRCYEYVKAHRIGARREERLSLYSEMVSTTPSSYNWPIPTGYHEIQGTPKTEMRYGAILKQLQEAHEKKDLPLAEKLVAAGLSENPLVPDLALAELRNLRMRKDPSILAKIEECLERFPLDLRFHFFKAISQETDDERVACWKEVLSVLEEHPPVYATFFQNDLVRIFVRHLGRIPALVPIAESLLKHLPESAELRFHLAHAQERAGNDKEALENFAWLLEARKKCLHNQEFFKHLQYGYLQSWYDGLEARTQTTPRKPSKKSSTTKTTKKKSPK